MLMMLLRLLIDALFHHPEGMTPGLFPDDFGELFAGLDLAASQLQTRRPQVQGLPRWHTPAFRHHNDHAESFGLHA